MRPLGTDLTDEDSRPYFLWDEDVSVRELKERLAAGGPEADRLRGKMLREARDTDVWLFTTPEAVAEALPRIERRVGRRLAFWQFLLDGWRRLGLLKV